MLPWMVYVLVVTLALSIAALSAEPALRMRQRATRWVWVAASLASLAVPTLIASISIRIPSITAPDVPGKHIVLRDLTSLPLHELSPVALPSVASPAEASLDAHLKTAWLIASGGLSLLLVASVAQLIWRQRRWTRTTVAGVGVQVAPGIGPAVVGLLRPRIVVPPWVVESDPQVQALVIAHEQSHLAARDPLLLTTGLALLILMPWNLPLWWQVRRLRRAIEVDCDARVLNAGHDLARYGETLIEVGRRQSAFLGTVAAMSESRSFLEQRLQIMLKKPGKWWKLSAALLGGASVCLVAVAVQVTPPNSHAGPGPDANKKTREVIAVDTTVYDGYVGSYAAGPGVFTIARDGNRLTARLTGQKALEMFPSSKTEFFYREVDAQVSFETDAQGRATALTLHQNGKHLRAIRTDEQAGQRAENALTVRVQSQAPYPGSEAALRRLYGSLLSGKPNYADMSPELAKATREQLPRLLEGAERMGPIQSVEFRGVNPAGMDVYDVRHERGRTSFRIAMAPDGKLLGAVMRPGP
jgi:bla regulator protein blaR1